MSKALSARPVRDDCANELNFKDLLNELRWDGLNSQPDEDL
jgi:hypothetical protein